MDYLKPLIKNAESRFIFYKQYIEDISRDKDTYPPSNELTIWLKQFVRDAKNAEQKQLKVLIEEKTYLNEGLNYPFCYYLKNEKEL